VNPVFGRKEPPRTQGQQIRDELGETYAHLRLAASHAAGGAAEKLTPPYDRARFVANRGWVTTKDAFAPLYDQVRSGAANARKEYVVPEMPEKKNRWGALLGLLAAGATVGAIGAVVMRRRKAEAQWDEYDKVTAGAASVADTVSAKAGKLADSLHEKSTPAETGASGTTSGMSDTTADLSDATSDLGKKATRAAEKATDKGADKTSDLPDRP
jgi:hypothetical protein